MIPKFKAFIKNDNKICDLKAIDFSEEYIVLETWNNLITFDFKDVILLHVLELDGKEFTEGDMFKTREGNIATLCFGEHQLKIDDTPLGLKSYGFYFKFKDRNNFYRKNRGTCHFHTDDFN
ncbi:MAG: hypothetical protein WC254_07615, partial [Candidatus Woesearchaeota archaeon]